MLTDFENSFTGRQTIIYINDTDLLISKKYTLRQQKRTILTHTYSFISKDEKA